MIKYYLRRVATNSTNFHERFDFDQDRFVSIREIRGQNRLLSRPSKHLTGDSLRFILKCYRIRAGFKELKICSILYVFK